MKHHMLSRLTEIVSSFIAFYWQAFVQKKNNRAVLLRETLQNLGSVFIKFGQLLALRPDFLPLSYCQELFYLLENVPPFSYSDVEKTFQKDFGISPNKLFKSFEKQPFAAASFGQVHKAVLKTGEKVAVKVQRPQIIELVERDLRLMKLMARIIDLLPLGPNKLFPVVHEFEMWTKEELDYLVEANYTEEFYQKAKDNPQGLSAPKVYRKYCSQRILTTEYIEGVTLSSVLIAEKNKDLEFLTRIKKMGFSHEDVAMKLLKRSAKQIYLDGFFHADPHPANIIFTTEKNLVYIDFGICGKLTREERISCLRYVRSVLYGDTENSFDALLHLCDTTKVKDMTGFKKEHDEIVKKTLELFEEAKNTNNRQVLGQKLILTLRLMQKYQATIPNDTMRYFRTIAIIESIVLSLNPQIEIESMADKFRNISIISLLKEMPDLLSEKTFNLRIVKWLNFVEKELLEDSSIQ